MATSSALLALSGIAENSLYANIFNSLSSIIPTDRFLDVFCRVPLFHLPTLEETSSAKFDLIFLFKIEALAPRLIPPNDISLLLSSLLDHECVYNPGELILTGRRSSTHCSISVYLGATGPSQDVLMIMD